MASPQKIGRTFFPCWCIEASHPLLKRSQQPTLTMGAFRYVTELWNKKQSDVMRFLLRIRAWEYRQQNILVRVPHPTRPYKARMLGYKSKAGYVIYRQRIARGGRRKHIRKSHNVGKPASAGITKLKPKMGLRAIAELKAGKRLGSLRLLNSYWVNEDGKFKWYEMIFIDPFHQKIREDPRINWICAAKHKHRECRGKTSAGKMSRGLRHKGANAHKKRPSRAAAYKRGNQVLLMKRR